AAVDDLEVLAPAQVPALRAAEASEKRHALARHAKRRSGIAGAVVHQADHPDGGGGKDGPAFRLVVERDVPRHDRRAERVAGVRDAQAGLLELPEDLRPLRVAEVEA